MTEHLGPMLAALPLWYMAFVLSATCHEAAHALVAYRGGDSTAYLGGQVTLDPRPHIKREPIGMIALPLVSFFLQHGDWMIGWASAPYNPYWANRYPRRAFAMSMAGPAANFALVALFLLIHNILVWQGWTGTPTGAIPFVYEGGQPFVDMLAGFCLLMVLLNTILGVFNLIPVPPLDGFSVFGILLTREQYQQVSDFVRQWWILGLLVAWHLFGLFFVHVRALFRLFIARPAMDLG